MQLVLLEKSQKVEVIKSAPNEMLSQNQVDRIASIKNAKRATRVLDRMKKRNLKD